MLFVYAQIALEGEGAWGREAGGIGGRQEWRETHTSRVDRGMDEHLHDAATRDNGHESIGGKHFVIAYQRHLSVWRTRSHFVRHFVIVLGHFVIVIGKTLSLPIYVTCPSVHVRFSLPPPLSLALSLCAFPSCSLALSLALARALSLQDLGLGLGYMDWGLI
jgi:hypothetical protein